MFLFALLDNNNSNLLILNGTMPQQGGDFYFSPDLVTGLLDFFVLIQVSRLRPRAYCSLLAQFEVQIGIGSQGSGSHNTLPVRQVFSAAQQLKPKLPTMSESPKAEELGESSDAVEASDGHYRCLTCKQMFGTMDKYATARGKSVPLICSKRYKNTQTGEHINKSDECYPCEAGWCKVQRYRR